MRRTLIALVILGITSAWCFAQETPATGGNAVSQTKDAGKEVKATKEGKKGRLKKKRMHSRHNQQNSQQVAPPAAPKEEKPAVK